MNYLENDIKVAKALQTLLPLGGYSYTITADDVAVRIESDGAATGYTVPTKAAIDAAIVAQA